MTVGGTRQLRLRRLVAEQGGEEERRKRDKGTGRKREGEEQGRRSEGGLSCYPGVHPPRAVGGCGVEVKQSERRLPPSLILSPTGHRRRGGMSGVCKEVSQGLHQGPLPSPLPLLLPLLHPLHLYLPLALSSSISSLPPCPPSPPASWLSPQHDKSGRSLASPLKISMSLQRDKSQIQ
eukprot:328637-Hanusia_phi.AAC.3